MCIKKPLWTLDQGWAILSVSVSFIDTLASYTKYRYQYRWVPASDTSIGIGIAEAQLTILVSVSVSLRKNTDTQRYQTSMSFFEIF